MARSRQFDALAHQRVEFHRQALRRAFLLRRLTRFQDLFHGVQQAVGIEQHELVELAPLRFFHLASLQGFEVEADGGDWRLQFVGDGVDEAVVLLVAANFADQKNRIEDEARNDGAKKNDAQKNLDALAPVEDDPAAANRTGERCQANAQREEEIDRFLAADDAHREIVMAQGEGVRSQVSGSAVASFGVRFYERCFVFPAMSTSKLSDELVSGPLAPRR